MTFATFEPVINAITSGLSFSSLIGIIAGALGVSLVFVLSWWGLRRAVKIVRSAVFKGKLRI